ncbi:MAG TPA: hypothetical protein VMC09_17035 [Anaerolineales bacterium]|nr:hypothetical protein [Anaerolineales bacterium]
MNESKDHSIQSWSPDGSKTALYDHGDLVIVDASCLKSSQPCTDVVRSHLPEAPSALKIAWTWDGKVAVWSTYYNGLDQVGFTTISFADLESGKITQISGPRGADLESISPDGKWLLLFSQENPGEGWILLSTNGQIVRRQNIGNFRGWLVIP